MKRLKTLASAVVAGTLALALAACGGNGATTETTDEGSSTAEAATGSTYKIGVLQLTEHAALDASNEGFVAALDDAGIDYEIDQQNAQNDQSACQTIASKLVNDGDDLILTIGTPAAQAVASATSDIPIIGTAITDFAESGLVADNEAPGGNVTGSSDLTPVADQIDLLQQLVPDAKTVGLLYCTAESNSEVQIAMAEEALDEAGIAHERYTVSSSNEIQQVVESMVGKVDAVYTPTDNTIAAGMATVSMVANENGLPVIVGCDTMVEDGGLASYSINYYDLGYKAGEMAVEILTEGADPAEMPIEYLAAEDCQLIANQATADEVGIDISGLEDAEIV
ncbi:ABC transporter substrate-binding protein [Collinsella tanakaei]|uniref:ABC transporter substrate-binding protein n=1 Tax=Collinsella ihumii TaxID=1720204 RepID=A0AAW7JRI5_9ACTN|nr:ABC transporter substrate-binding protein [Collinsella ihumii]MBM6786264.1 ABC transporter substrate-binding protein [Collinsella tanakaei]MBM6905074.1 ABC transporter substrate-binding protein [Collinsella tanakaei]MDN0069964.1 ABC transporter substrate-binding protein [Collinsella ihumii]